MRQNLKSLIEKMSVVEKPSTNSDSSIAWRAHREAELLRDPSLVDELAGYLATTPTNSHRKSVYFILGKLGRQVRKGDCTSLLLTSLNHENDKYVLAGVLNALSELNVTRNDALDRVFDLLRDNRWLVRHSAIRALQGTNSQQCEQQIIALLETTTDQYDMTYCHATLGKIGTTKSIPYLENNLKSAKRDVRISAQTAIDNIQERLEPKKLITVGEFIQ
jgi:hypothetical protein